MIYVYKQSAAPLHPWDVLRHGGPNNIAPETKAKYLLLLNADVVQRDGLYHYIFEFDTRDTLKKSSLAQLTQAPGKAAEYPNGMDWAKWLTAHDVASEDGTSSPMWQVITADVRWEILHMAPQSPDSGKRNVVITGLRPVSGNGAPSKPFLPAPAPAASTAMVPSTGTVPAIAAPQRKYVQSRMFDDENLLLALPISA